MSKEISLLSKVLGTDEATLTAKMSDENGFKEIEAQVSNLKVFKTNNEFTSVMNNYKDSLKDTLYAEHKGSIHEKIENDLMSKYGVQMKRGEHYTKTDELFDKIIDEKTKQIKAASTGDDKEFQKAQAKIEELTKQMTEKETSIRGEYEGKLKSLYIGSALAGIKPLLDEPTELLDGKLDFIKFQFEKDFSVREKDGKNIVYKGDEIYRDSTYKEVPLESVLMEIASRVSKVKTSPAAGRGANPLPANDPNAIDFSSFKTWDEFLDTQTELRKLTIGDSRLNKYYAAFKKSKEG